MYASVQENIKTIWGVEQQDEDSFSLCVSVNLSLCKLCLPNKHILKQKEFAVVILYSKSVNVCVSVGIKNLAQQLEHPHSSLECCWIWFLVPAPDSSLLVMQTLKVVVMTQVWHPPGRSALRFWLLALISAQTQSLWAFGSESMDKNSVSLSLSKIVCVCRNVRKKKELGQVYILI